MGESRAARRRERMLIGYVVAVAFAGTGVLAFLAGGGFDIRPLGLLGLLLGAMAVAELFPMVVPWRDQTLRFTLSTTFALMILFANGPAVAAAAQTLLWAVVFSIQRKGWLKVAFNSGQIVLCLGAAAWVAETLGANVGDPSAFAHRLGPGAVVAMVVAVAVFLAANLLLTAVARSLSSGVRLREILSASLNAELWIELASLLFVPVLLLTVEHSVWLFVLTWIPMIGFYFAIQVALQNGALLEEKNRSLDVQQETERKLRQAQKMEAVGQLAGGVAHDFNNLLSVILNYAKFARADIPPESPIREDLDEVVNAGERAARLTRQLLSFSRQEVLAPELLGINEVVFEMDKMLRRTIGEDIEMSTVAADGPLVHIDRGQLEQIVLNLALNARDAMPKGGRLLIETDAVTILEDGTESVAPGHYARLRVSDTGCGIPAEQLERIFEPFFTTKEPGRGTGLGLATIYGAVQRGGGGLDVSSEVGRGTEFSVFFPATTDVAAAPTEAENNTADLTGQTVLLVEDEDAVRTMVERLLRQLGADVLSASSGPEALNLSRSHPGTLDILITDVVMPKMSGKELARELTDLRNGTPVLFMSGYTHNHVAAHGILAEGEHLLQKPFDAEGLRDAVRSLLAEVSAIGA